MLRNLHTYEALGVSTTQFGSLQTQNQIVKNNRSTSVWRCTKIAIWSEPVHLIFFLILVFSDHKKRKTREIMFNNEIHLAHTLV